MENKILVFRNDMNGVCKVNNKDVMYFKQNARRVRVELRKGSFETKIKMDKLEEVLPKCYYRVHSYLIINVAAVREMKSSYVYFDNGQELFISKNFCRATREAIIDYYKALL